MIPSRYYCPLCGSSDTGSIVYETNNDYHFPRQLSRRKNRHCLHCYLEWFDKEPANEGLMNMPIIKMECTREEIATEVTRLMALPTITPVNRAILVLIRRLGRQQT